MINVAEFLEKNVQKHAQKTAIIEPNRTISYGELNTQVNHIASHLQKYVSSKTVVGVYMEKGIDAVVSFLALAKNNHCYSLLNPALPQERLRQMAQVIDLRYIMTTQRDLEKVQAIFPDCLVLCVDTLLQEDIKQVFVPIHELDTNPLYINFTSGSTGVPKAIAVSHRSVIDFIVHFTTQFKLNEQDVLANQAPFDFDVSVKDIYSALATGATLLIVPTAYFSQPTTLMDYLCEHQATTLIWAVSALALLSAFHALEYRTPHSVNKILFSGEVMPLKHLKNFQKYLPSALFVNLYGPTEITCNCTYHIIDSNRDYSTGIPIGKPFANEDVFLLSNDHTLIAEKHVVGEVCVKGTALALGYYGNFEQTQRVFIQNPLNQYYPEIIYKTGDLAFYDDNGDLVFAGRKDFQIKYKGHRIELEEIEQAILSIDGVEQCAGLFDEKKGRLKVAYSGEVSVEALLSCVQERLPEYMVPNRFVHFEALPLNKNGKIDRQALKEKV